MNFNVNKGKPARCLAGKDRRFETMTSMGTQTIQTFIEMVGKAFFNTSGIRTRITKKKKSLLLSY